MPSKDAHPVLPDSRIHDARDQRKPLNIVELAATSSRRYFVASKTFTNWPSCRAC
jgi:hypothetical protein